MPKMYRKAPARPQSVPSAKQPELISRRVGEIMGDDGDAQPYGPSGAKCQPNAPAKLQRGHIRVAAKPQQINKPFVSFSVR
jgi:hypothetical protein